MTQQNLSSPAAADDQAARLAALHQLAAADYASTAHLRQLNPTWPTRPAGIRTAAVPQADRPVVRHANGLEFRVIDADSYTARMARDVRQLTMADGTVWTVGQPVGWHGTPAAWQPPAAADDACPLCGRWTCDPATCPPAASAGAARDQLALARAHAAEGGGRR